jgi:uncharacterized membrane protein YhaH (DUF805 family)
LKGRDRSQSFWENLILFLVCFLVSNLLFQYLPLISSLQNKIFVIGHSTLIILLCLLKINAIEEEENFEAVSKEENEKY